MRRLSLLGSVPVLLLSTVLSGQQAGLTTAQIEKPAPDSWPTYNGDYSGRRFSTLTKINASNVKNLSVAWIYDLAGGGQLKATPVQVERGSVFLDARSCLRGGGADGPRALALHVDAQPGRHAHRQPRHGRPRRLGVLRHA